MSALIVLNVIALICGFAGKNLLMYILFGITWIAFSNKYAKIIWTLIYERFLVEWESTEVLVNLKISNVVVTFFTMACIYGAIYFKLCGLCPIMSMLQCLIHQGVYTYKENSDKNKLLIAGAALEFLLAFFAGK